MDAVSLSLSFAFLALLDERLNEKSWLLFCLFMWVSLCYCLWTIRRPNMVYIIVSYLSNFWFMWCLYYLWLSWFYCFADNAYGVYVSSHIFPARIREWIMSCSLVSLKHFVVVFMSVFCIWIWLQRHFLFTCLSQIYSPQLDSPTPRWVHFAHGSLLFLYQVCVSLSLSFECVLTPFLFLKPFELFLDIWCGWWEASKKNELL